MTNMLRFLTFFALLASLMLVAACTDDPETGAVHIPTSAKSPTPAPAGGHNLSGGLDSGGAGLPTVRFVQVDQASLSLNAPAADGTTPAGFADTATLSARVVLSNGQLDPLGVRWSVSDPESLTIDEAGTVAVRAGAATGSLMVTASSVLDPTRQAACYVAVTNDGRLSLTLDVPTLSGLGAVDANLVITDRQNGRTVLQQRIGDQADLRLPPGAYDALVTLGGGASRLHGTLTDVVITPNGLTPRTLTLD